MAEIYLTAQDIAKMAGLSTLTIASYIRDGRLPEPDIWLGALTERPLRGWKKETIEHWLKNRPGRGARTDLKN